MPIFANLRHLREKTGKPAKTVPIQSNQALRLAVAAALVPCLLTLPALAQQSESEAESENAVSWVNPEPTEVGTGLTHFRFQSKALEREVEKNDHRGADSPDR